MVNPRIWGKAGWTFLISSVADYPDNPDINFQHNYNRFFQHLTYTLPCDVCRANYSEHFKRWPIDQYLKSRAALFRWIMIMYNEVQTQLNKKTKGPQELLYELFGPEEGERMMQRLVYEDPDANITVIKPFDPTIDQYGGAVKTEQMGNVTSATVNNEPPAISVIPKTTETIRYPSRISDLGGNKVQQIPSNMPSSFSTNTWGMILILLLLLFFGYYLLRNKVA